MPTSAPAVIAKLNTTSEINLSPVNETTRIADRSYGVPNCSECDRVSADLRLTMDLSASPCTDFEQFVCGSYEKNFPGKEFLSSWGVLESIQERTYEEMADFLEAAQSEEGDDDLTRNIKRIYR